MTQRAGAKSDNIPMAVAVILVTVLALSLGDALIKKSSASFVLWQIFVLRSMIAIPVLLAVMRFRYASVPLKPYAVGWTAARSLMLTSMWITYYASLPHLELSIAAAAYYTLPIFITLFAALFGGEAVGHLGWLAVVLGFSGVTLILKPNAGDFNLYALLPLISAMLYALAMLLTRTKCREEHPLILSLALNISFIAVGSIATLIMMLAGDIVPSSSFLSGVWMPMGTNELAAIILLTIAILVGSVGAAIAYQLGPSSVVATFDFAYVGFAAIWGLMFFGEVPGTTALAGIALIVGAGFLAVRR